jgi:hypothetical protein
LGDAIADVRRTVSKVSPVPTIAAILFMKPVYPTNDRRLPVMCLTTPRTRTGRMPRRTGAAFADNCRYEQSTPNPDAHRD